MGFYNPSPGRKSEKLTSKTAVFRNALQGGHTVDSTGPKTTHRVDGADGSSAQALSQTIFFQKQFRSTKLNTQFDQSSEMWHIAPCESGYFTM